jgi:hypothetical protein
MKTDLRLRWATGMQPLEQVSQRVVVVFMLLLPAMAIAGLFWMMYDKLFSKPKHRAKSPEQKRAEKGCVARSHRPAKR